MSVVLLDYSASLGSTTYNPRADLNADGQITIIDIGLAFYYGALNFV